MELMEMPIRENKIPTGYKETEVGVIPVDWFVIQLSELGNFSKGQGIRKDESNSGEIPCVRYGEIYTRHNNYIKQFFSFISKEIATTSKKLRKGDLLFAGSGETKEDIGKCVAFLGEMEAYAGGDIVLLSIKNYNSLFLGFLLNSPIMVKQKASRGQGDAVVHISANQLKNISIPIPPTLSEQTAIATALSDADALISSLEQLIAKKKLIKKGAMQELLRVREGWVERKLGEVLDYEQPTDYLVTDTEYNDNNSIPVLTAGKTFILGYTNEQHGIYKDLPVIIFDDFTTATKFVDFPFKAKSSAMKMLKPRTKEVNMRFIFEIMQRIKCPLGDHKRHWIGEFQNLVIKVPNSIEQEKISAILSELEKSIDATEDKLNKIKKIKQGMLQDLLTGRVRLV